MQVGLLFFVCVQGSSSSTSASGPGAGEKPEPVSPFGSPPLPQPQPRLPPQHYPKTGNYQRPENLKRREKKEILSEMTIFFSPTSILQRPPLSPCRGWLIWFSPARGPWMCYRCSACANSSFTMLLTTACQSKTMTRAAVKSRKPRRDKYADRETKHYSF